MKKIVFFIFFILCFNSYSQKMEELNYSFDYFTIYSFKENLSDTLNNTKEIYFSNSKDSSYILFVTTSKDTISRAILTDYKNKRKLFYKDHIYPNKINDIKLFNSATYVKYDLDHCIKAKNSVYTIEYSSIDNKNLIKITRFKNKRRKKIINESFFETTPSEITKNQHYNLGILATSLWCEKFILKNNEIITNSYFIEKGEKKYFRKLLQIEKTDFTINSTINKITTN
jgi:hypothetical protein